MNDGIQHVEGQAYREVRRGSGFFAWVRDLSIAVFVSVVVIIVFYQPVRVEGTSMLPVLEDEDRLVINKFIYSQMGSLVGGTVQRGDVVVFHYPYDPAKSYIKRVIALPGDKLKIVRGKVSVNGVALSETYVPVKFQDERSLPEMTIPAGKYWMMGDHRSISSDSREFGPVDRSFIYGRAAFVFWPVDQAGVVH